ncbi:MAG: queuosine salvage family protein [Deltaproteobacteria bacterium]|nr:queuosine salvage family protein [Deltaproteobacteria bacterium]
MREVIESVQYVSERSRWVRIDHAVLDRFVRKRSIEPLRLPPWDPAYHFHDGTEKTVAYLLVVDALNFCFWPEKGKEKWRVCFGTERLDGYYALAAALTQAVKRGEPILDPGFLEAVTAERLARILDGHGELQLMRRRAENLNELGVFLSDSYGGEAARLVEAAKGSAARLARLLARELPSFRDTAEYDGREISFLKRAQIVAADLHGAFAGKAWGAFSDLDRLTAFADYKLPQVLRHLNMLVYEDSLARKVDRCITLPSGSPQEVEIRANTVWCVELMRRGLRERGISANAFEMDWYLWNLGQEEEFRHKPYHRTPTIFY